MNLKIKGLVAAPFTPMNADGSVNFGMIPDYAELLHQDQVAGVFVCGTTGEGLLLSQNERQQVVECWRSSIPSTMKMIVNVSHHCLGEMKSLIKHAEEVGVDAIAFHATSFFTPPNMDVFLSYFAEVAHATVLPFYYYHMPSKTGFDIKVAELLRKVEGRFPNFAGIKYTHEDMADFQQCLELGKGNLDIFFGRDELFLHGSNLGAQGFVGSTYNFAAPLYLETLNLAKHGDDAGAEEMSSLTRNMVLSVVEKGGIPAMKACMKSRGIDCGPCRLPLQNLTAEVERDVLNYMETIIHNNGGLFDKSHGHYVASASCREARTAERELVEAI